MTKWRGLAMTKWRGLAMTGRRGLARMKGCHCEERSDAAIHVGMKSWIATA